MIFYGHMHGSSSIYFWKFVNTFGKHFRGANSGLSNKGDTQRNYISSYLNPQAAAPTWKYRIRILVSYKTFFFFLANYCVNYTYGLLPEIHRSLSSPLNGQNFPFNSIQPIKIYVLVLRCLGSLWNFFSQI